MESLSYTNYYLAEQQTAIGIPQPLLSSELPQEIPHTSGIETRIIGKRNGRDIRATVAVAPDGTTIFDHQPTEIQLFNAMFEKVDSGVHTFDGYQYPAEVLSQQLVGHQSDAIGNTRMIFEVYLRGEHYRNGVGERVPKEIAWSTSRDSYGNTIKEDETRSYIIVSATPYQPERVHSHLVELGDPAYPEAKNIVRRLSDDPVAQTRVQLIERRIGAYREKKNQQVVSEAQAKVA